MFEAENRIRELAEMYQNSYLMGIFACCRQVFNIADIRGIFSKEEIKDPTNTIM